MTALDGVMNSPATTSTYMPLYGIDVVDRHREDLGNLEDLRDSIRTVGLLHPIVVTASGRLVAGQRRLEACRALGWAEVPVTIVNSLSSAMDLLAAERDENVCRLDMKPSEKVALGLALEELERPSAAERRREGNARGGRGNEVEENFASTSNGHRTGKVYDLVGEAIGMSGTTYSRAKAVVQHASNTTLPADERERAHDALAEMDATGKVSPAYQKINPDRLEYPSQPAPTFKIVTARDRSVAAKAKQRIEKAVGTCNGLARGLDLLSPERALLVADPEEVAGWDEAFRDASAAIKRIRAQIKGSVQ